jgi:hypothetical protein
MTTQSKLDFIFKTLAASGVPIKTFATITSVSRTTLHSWKNGNNVTDQLRLNLTYNMARRLAKAVEANKLPLPADTKMTAAERVRTVKEIAMAAG